MQEPKPPSPRKRAGSTRGTALLILVALWSVSNLGSATRADDASRTETGETPDVAAAPPASVLPPEQGAVVADYGTVAIASLPLYSPEAPGAAILDPQPAATLVTKGILARGQSLGPALRAQGVDSSVVHTITREMRSKFDFRRAQPGDAYRLTQDASGQVLEFRYRDERDSSLYLRWDGSRYSVRREHLELVPRVTRLRGVVSSSLYDAIRDAGGDPALAGDFADIFAWDIDFTRAVHAGDDFQLVYERLLRVDEDGRESYVRPGRILAARYAGVVGEYSAVYFEEDQSEAGAYYRPDGSSVERRFLVAPLKYSRISSKYSSSRRHPILNVTRPHHGIDYAAPEGTPVWSIADGTVIYRGWAGGFGNLIKVRHTNGYVSFYAHLSRYGDGLKVGQKVEQKEVIGYVGHTGLATGSHICFRVAKDGRYVNPSVMGSPVNRPISKAAWSEFTVVRDELLSRLQADTVVLVDEAL